MGETVIIMDRIETPESSNILDIGWKENVLEITFRRGGRYRYFGVGETIWESFRGAKSKGQFFYRVIRGNYREEIVFGGGAT